jgi:hypothetical protein
MSERPVVTCTSVILTCNYFASLRMVEVNLVSTVAYGTESEPCTQQQVTPAPKAIGRPPVIIVTASIYILQLQGELKPLRKIHLSSQPPGIR